MRAGFAAHELGCALGKYGLAQDALLPPLRRGVALVRGELEQHCCPLVILRHATSFKIRASEVELRIRIALVCSKLEQLRRLHYILGHALSATIQASKPPLRVGVGVATISYNR